MHYGCGHPEVLWQIHLRSNPGVLLRQVNFNCYKDFRNLKFFFSEAEYYYEWRTKFDNEAVHVKSSTDSIRLFITSKLNCFFLKQELCQKFPILVFLSSIENPNPNPSYFKNSIVSLFQLSPILAKFEDIFVCRTWKGFNDILDCYR